MHGVNFTKYFKTVYKSLFDFIVFDIETRGSQQQITEFAFINNFDKAFYKLTELGGDALHKKIQDSFSTKSILVGHNIRRFDLKVLKEKLGMAFDQNLVYDTLEVECLLNPLRNSFALDTVHNAEKDTENTAWLFINQLHRLLLPDSSRSISFLPKQVKSFIEGQKNIWKNLPVSFKDKTFLQKQTTFSNQKVWMPSRTALNL